jgi:hypothetical protein
MKSAFFLLLRLICYATLAILLAASASLVIVSVNGQCPTVTEMGVTCATGLSQGLADFGLAVGEFTLDTGVPLVVAVGGLIFLIRDLGPRRHRRRRSRSTSSGTD